MPIDKIPNFLNFFPRLLNEILPGGTQSNLGSGSDGYLSSKGRSLVELKQGRYAQNFSAGVDGAVEVTPIDGGSDGVTGFQGVMIEPRLIGMSTDQVVKGMLDIAGARTPEMAALEIIQSPTTSSVIWYQHLSGLLGAFQRQNVLQQSVTNKSSKEVRIEYNSIPLSSYPNYEKKDVIECPVNHGEWVFNLDTGTVTHRLYVTLGGDLGGGIGKKIADWASSHGIPSLMKQKIQRVLDLAGR